jgi:hypothetical protein
MTPHQITILLFYATRVPGAEFTFVPESNASIDDHAWMLDEGLIRESTVRDWYELTERGRVYFEAIKNVPLPRSSWVIDWPTVSQGTSVDPR